MIIIMMINWFGNGWDCKMKFVCIYLKHEMRLCEIAIKLLKVK